MPKRFVPNQFQQAALTVYAEGDYQTTNTREIDGDSLLTFVLSELATDQDCDNRATAVQRMESAIDDLTGVLEALKALGD